MKNLKCFVALALLACMAYPVHAQKNIQPIDMRILYVGGSGNWLNLEDKEAKEKDIQQRMHSFEMMLKHYFTDVTVMDAKDYTQAASADFDVTIIDGTPKPTKERQVIKGADGKIKKYIPAAYLTEDFDKPMLFIGETGEKLGRAIGLKLDWYCLCLDAYAHSYRKDHEIFNGPFPVKMTEEIKPTPSDAFHYEYFSDEPNPKELTMWRVQTKGYQTDEGFRIGMVARPWGFEDSPDAEYISSGVCAKTLDAVAIGRHGNFLEWGFAASPEYMTDEAKSVLANAIVYISKFDGKNVIARKYLDRRATKEYIKERKYLATRKAAEDYSKLYEEFDKTMMALKAAAEKKKANNEQLTQREEMSLSYQPQPKVTYERLLKKYQGGLYKKFGTDTKAYMDYYNKNYDYFYSEDASYVITVDEDVKSLGIPNTDMRLLDKCISMLENGVEVDKAKRILDRYTLLQFNTAKEWRRWYEKNKGRLFFTQSGGWYFMVNTRDEDVKGNNYHIGEPKDVSYESIQPGETSHQHAVSVATGVVDLKNDKKEVVVKIKIHPGYHIYAYVSKKDPYINTELKIRLPEGYKKVGELVKPSFKYFNEKGTTIYEDEIMFKQIIEGSGKGEVSVELRYQCCDAHICFPPSEEEHIIQLPS